MQEEYKRTIIKSLEQCNDMELLDFILQLLNKS